MTNQKLIKEMDAAYQQLELYRNNRHLSSVPKHLANKIAYLRSYAMAVYNLEKLTRENRVESVAKRLQEQYFGKKF